GKSRRTTIRNFCAGLKQHRSRSRSPSLANLGARTDLERSCLRREERSMSADIMSEDRLQATKNLTAIVYALQAVGFLLGITWVVAIIVNYVKKEDVKGTWLESHFRWQIRTFWFGLLWAVFGFLFMITIIGWFVGMFILMVD